MTINKKKLDRAQVAVAEFRRLQPTLTAYAKNLTGRSDVRVQMSSGTPRTDGTTIYLSPDLAMADMALVRHEKVLCDKREENTFELLCRACSAREDVLAKVYHEIAHIAFQTFDRTEEADARNALRMMSEFAPEWYVDRMENKFANQGYVFRHGFLELAQAVSPYLQGLANGLEDVRINARMADARPGTRVMMKAMIYGLALNGVEQKDARGKTVKIRYPEYDLNLQASIAAFCVASEYDTAGWFSDRVEAAMADAQVSALLRTAADAPSHRSIFSISFQVFMRLRELGFFQLVDEEPPPVPAPEEPKDDEQSDEPADDGAAGDGAGTPDGGAATSGAGDDAQAGDGGSPDGSGSGNGRSEGVGGEGSTDGDRDDADLDGGVDGGEPASDRGSDDSLGDGSGGGAEDPGLNEPVSDSAGSSSGSGDEDSMSEDTPVEVAGGSEPGRDDESKGHGSDDLDSDSSDGSQDSRSLESDATGDRHDQKAYPVGDDLVPDLDSVDGEGERSRPVGDSGSDHGSVEADADPLDYQPSEAIDRTGDAPEPIKPTMSSNQEITLVDMGLHGTEAPKPTDAEEKAMEAAIAQAEYFEGPSTEITGVKIWKYADRETDRLGRDWHAWGSTRGAYGRHRGTKVDNVPESILSPALMRMRLVFADNKRTQHDRNRKSGRIDTRVLGKRAWSGDDRLFGRKVQPGRRDYMVMILLDVSGSTVGTNLRIIKEAGMAQAELCSRMGLDFAVYAHTGSPKNEDNYNDLWVDLYEVKAPESPWDNTAREALSSLSSSVCNLDGHTLEVAVKMLDGMTHTDKVILYYSDGAMPAENHDEELEVLTRSIKACKQKKITLLGVGIRTDSPARHGLDTVKIDDSSEVGAVVTHLERVLLR